MQTMQIQIAGMTCQNCVRHVTEALSEIPGVREVVVSLANGAATVETDRQISRDELKAALDDAGYELA